MVIDLASQRAAVYRNGKLIGISTIASGKPGYETPDGVFTVLEKEKSHRSNKYDDAPMPYMQRLTWSGLALHGGHPRGYPASHGCIRLPMGFAAALFKEDTHGMQVVITGHAPPGKAETAIASREKPPTSSQENDLQAAKFSSGQSDAIAAQDLDAANGETNDQSAYGADNGNVDRYPDPSGSNGGPDGHERRQTDRERLREVPAGDLPPPPG